MVSAYQSGFAYALANSHRKPGLTCHASAIEMYLAEGVQKYDFLAGGDRYKLTLANAQAKRYWLRITPAGRYRISSCWQGWGGTARRAA